MAKTPKKRNQKKKASSRTAPVKKVQNSEYDTVSVSRLVKVTIQRKYADRADDLIVEAAGSLEEKIAGIKVSVSAKPTIKTVRRAK
ncbi:hypothetical protein KAR91_51935 [Candidatus Pacearchaeota archaeon]|nr:hypothetical protein [Candidatus Pacearchaeota archaeon]